MRGVTIYLNPSWAEASVDVLMPLVLLFRAGLLGARILKFE